MPSPGSQQLFAILQPPTNAPFYGAKLKIERAKQHIADLEESFRQFMKLHPRALSIREDNERGKTIVHLDFGKLLPPTFGLIIGDAVHNLRSALDLANWELRGLDGGTQDRYTKLPVADTRSGYEAMCNGIKTPKGDLPDFFKTREFFKDGAGEIIYSLHDLDVVDKHMVLPTTGRSFVIPAMNAIVSVLSVNIENPAYVGEPLKIDGNTDPALDICFGDITVLSSSLLSQRSWI